MPQHDNGIPMPKPRSRAGDQGFKDAAELIELVHDCDRDYVWATLSGWGATRVAVAAIVLAAAHRTDTNLAARLAWTVELAALAEVA